MINPLATDSTGRNEGSSSSSQTNTITKDPLANKEVFLSLLVAQIKNQDPMNPTDSVQFLTQLSQFTQTEQTLGIREDLKAIRSAIEALGPTTSS